VGHSLDYREDGNKDENNKEDLSAISQILPTKRNHNNYSSILLNKSLCLKPVSK
jgi:hypothetical protein